MVGALSDRDLAGKTHDAPRKAKIEDAVQVAQRWILARLRIVARENPPFPRHKPQAELGRSISGTTGTPETLIA